MSRDDTDRFEPLERLAQRAPVTDPLLLAETITERGRQVVQRRRAGLSIAAAALAAGAVVMAASVGGPAAVPGGKEAPVATASESQPTTAPPPSSEPSLEVRVMATAVVEELSNSYPGAGRIWLRDSVCPQWDDWRTEADPAHCSRLDATERAAVERALFDLRISWVADGSTPDGSRIGTDQHPPYVELSELSVARGGGSVFVFAIAGGLDCSGARYDVTLSPNGDDTAVPSGEMVVC